MACYLLFILLLQRESHFQRLPRFHEGLSLFPVGHVEMDDAQDIGAGEQQQVGGQLKNTKGP